MKLMSQRLLEERTGRSLEAWNKRVAAQKPKDEAALRAWLEMEGVTGYAQSLLVMERFGYADWMTASAESLIDAQYEGKQELRAVFDAVVDAAVSCGEVAIQARKTYVSLVGPKRTFARIQAKKQRVDVGLRLDRAPRGRLKPSKIHETMPVQLELAALDDLDADALAWIQKAYEGSA